MQVMLVGNPNCGKTTLFNALTGDNQRVGNWAGVTVDKKTGAFVVAGKSIEITDLPGVYSLVTSAPGASLDEQIAADAVAHLPVDLIINVVDACHLERHLYLTSQLMERGVPLVLVLNMSDIAVLRGIQIDAVALSHQLQCPVVVVQAHRQVGLEALRQAIVTHPSIVPPLPLRLTSSLRDALTQLEQQLLSHGDDPDLVVYLARRVMEGDQILLTDRHSQITERIICAEADVLMADARYQAVHDVVAKVQHKRTDASDHFTAKLDRLVLHRVWALPIFFAMMYVMFLLAINVGGAFQPFFDLTTDAIFVKGVAWLLQQWHSPAWVVALCANGVGKGINTTLTFIPVIASMFFFLSLLEASGYMARAAFVVDRVMRALGLPGKSFVPLIVGFGCNVPAIIATRSLDSEYDRLLTILMSPFMSCSARLAIYAVFVAAFFPEGGQNIVFSLYLIGILMAVFTGFLLRKTLLRGKASPLILELPAYHRPAFRRLVRETGVRLRYFLTRAGKFIIPVCVVLGGLNALTIHGSVIVGDASHESILSWFGQWLTPVFAPMGLHPSNWPATVGLLTGMLAKEVVVGSLNSLYSQMGHITPVMLTGFDFWAEIQAALASIPENLAQLGHAVMNPLAASAPQGDVSESVYGVMVQQFDGKVGAYAYLLFILLYVPCVSTMAAIRQEASRRWMWFSVAWSCLVAYVVAVLFYQVATVQRHPQQTGAWLVGLFCVVLIAIVVGIRMTHGGKRHVVATA